MTIYIVAFLLGVVAGLRALTPVAAVSWGARVGHLVVDGTWLSFLTAPLAPWILSALALFEIVNDKLPKTPSRKVPVQFATRVLTGALSGAAVSAGYVGWLYGAFAGVIGAVVGTLAGAELRGRLAKSFGSDLPAALVEDAIAVVAAFGLVFMLP